MKEVLILVLGLCMAFAFPSCSDDGMIITEPPFVRLISPCLDFIRRWESPEADTSRIIPGMMEDNQVCDIIGGLYKSKSAV